VVGQAIVTGDADREPAGAGAEGGLAFGKRADVIPSSEFRHGGRRWGPDTKSMFARWKRQTTTLREAGDHVVRERKSPTKGARDYHVRDCASGLLARFEGASEHSRALQRTAAVTSPAPAGNSPAASSDYFERRRTL
jgi:hypothetical protein